jgi:hypothetical protein
LAKFYIKWKHQNEKFEGLAFFCNAERVKKTEDGYALFECSEECYQYLNKQFPGRLIKDPD